MTAASVAALTVYDMVKSADRFVTISAIRLLEKSGGASGHWRRPAPKDGRARPVSDEPEAGGPPADAGAPSEARTGESLSVDRPRARTAAGPAALVVTVSDGVAAGTRDDQSGAVAAERLTELGFQVERDVVADEPDELAAIVVAAADRRHDASW